MGEFQICMRNFIPILYLEYEYGWNDPPSFSYSATSSSQTPSGKLTKRPSYPPSNDITTTPSTATPPPALAAPPTTSTFCVGANATKKTTSEPKEEATKNLSVYDDADFTEVIQKLNDLTDNVREKLQVRSECMHSVRKAYNMFVAIVEKTVR